MKTVWVVCKVNAQNWEIQSVCTSEELAIKYAKDNPNYFIGPMELDELLPDENIDWEGGYYPYYELQEVK